MRPLHAPYVLAEIRERRLGTDASAEIPHLAGPRLEIGVVRHAAFLLTSLCADFRGILAGAQLARGFEVCNGAFAEALRRNPHLLDCAIAYGNLRSASSD